MDRFLAYLAIGVSSGLVYGLLTLGIVLIYKGSRVLNFAHPYFGLLAAFITWWLTAKASFFPFSLMPFADGTRPRFAVAVVVGLSIIALYGFAIEHGVMRRLKTAPRLVQLVATIALAQGAVGIVAVLFTRSERQEGELRVLPTLLPDTWGFDVANRRVDAADLQVLIITPLICIAAALFFTRTKFGVAVRAAAENGEAARLLGIPASRVSVFVWVTGAVLAGIAGILISQVRNSLDPATLSTGFLVRGLAAGLVGGLTSLPGAIVGGLVVGIGEAMAGLATDNQTGVPETLMFAVVIGILVFRPGGLFGQREETEDKVAFVQTIRALPSHLRDSAAAKGVHALGFLIAGVVALLPLTTGSEVTGILTRVVIVAMVGVSLTVLMGYSGQISLGHWGLAGVGAFALANMYTRFHWPYLISLPLSVVTGMVVSLVIGLPALRIRGLYLAVATLAFNLAAEFFLFQSESIGRGTAGFIIDAPKLGPFDLDNPSNRPMFYFSLMFLLLSMLVARNLARSRTGRGFFALRENEKAAATMGVGLTKFKLLAFAVSGGIAALAGALYATDLDRTDSRLWFTAFSILLVTIVMIGGIGSLIGPLLGAFLVRGLPELVHFENPWIVPIGTGLLLLIVLIRIPGGLAGLLFRIRDALVRGIHDLAQQQQPAASPPSPTPTA